MNDTSYITVWSPNAEEKEMGITFAHKVRIAYTKLQVLVDNLNADYIKTQDEIKNAKKAAEQARNDADTTAKKSFRRL
jgi:molecular chaperone GrpE (heat shock protein)